MENLFDKEEEKKVFFYEVIKEIVGVFNFCFGDLVINKKYLENFGKEWIKK